MLATWYITVLAKETRVAPAKAADAPDSVVARARIATADQTVAIDVSATRQHAEHHEQVQQSERKGAACCPFS